MREIKFQIYWIAGHEMLYDTNSDLEFRDKENYWITDLYDAINHPERYKVRQYTGINGNGNEEIYDGDIIRLWERSPNGNESTYILKVYQKENGTWMAEGYPEDDNLYGTYRTRIELYSHRQQVDVIGNIYENPELLR